MQPYHCVTHQFVLDYAYSVVVLYYVQSLTLEETAMHLVRHAPSTPDRVLIKKLRAHFQMNQVDLASMSRVSLATISKIESGELKNPQLETLNAIAKAFNINTAQLLTTETPEPGNFGLATQLTGTEQ